MLVVVALAAGSAVLSRHASDPPPPPASSTSTPTPTPSMTPSPAPTSGAPTAPASRTVIRVRPVGVGQVPAAYFLPGAAWSGSDLLDGVAMTSREPTEFEGSVQRFACDPDTAMSGNVAFVQTVTRDGTMVGTQKVRLLADPGRAAQAFAKIVADLEQCQQRLTDQAIRDHAQAPPGEPVLQPTAEVNEDPAGRVDDATGAARVYRTETDYHTGQGSRLVEWVAVLREGSAVSLIDVIQTDGAKVTPSALRRIAVEARAQLAWASAR